MAAIVTAACVIVKRADNTDAYFYQDAELPDGLKGGEIERLVEAGLVSTSGEKPARKPTAK